MIDEHLIGLFYLEEHSLMPWPEDTKELTALGKISSKIADHLMQQSAVSASVSPEGRNDECLYRGPNGLMCAVGCLISDASMAFVTESSTADNVISGSVDAFRDVIRAGGLECEPGDVSVDFHRSLDQLLLHWQSYHDNEGAYAAWIKRGKPVLGEVDRTGMSPLEVNQEVLYAMIVKRAER